MGADKGTNPALGMAQRIQIICTTNECSYLVKETEDRMLAIICKMN